jgi:hypothetical protein
MPRNAGPACRGTVDRHAAESWTGMARNTQLKIPAIFRQLPSGIRAFSRITSRRTHGGLGRLRLMGDAASFRRPIRTGVGPLLRKTQASSGTTNAATPMNRTISNEVPLLLMAKAAQDAHQPRRRRRQAGAALPHRLNSLSSFRDDPIGPEGVVHDNTVYLVPNSSCSKRRRNTSSRTLGPSWSARFPTGMRIRKSGPSQRNWEMFRKWFTLEVHSTVVDVADEAIEALDD